MKFNWRKLIILLLVCIIGLTLFLLFEYIENSKSEIDIYKNNRYVYHALGEIGGYKYTNSLEAFQYFYERGARLFEADFSTTKDDVWVLRHDWENTLGQYNLDLTTKPTLNRFKNSKFYDTYTPLSIYDLLSLMEIYDDFYVITDTKYSTKVMLKSNLKM